MVRKCSVPNCIFKSEKVTLFSPSTEEIAELWSEILNCKLIKKKSYVCEKHFRPDDYMCRYYAEKDGKAILDVSNLYFYLVLNEHIGFRNNFQDIYKVLFGGFMFSIFSQKYNLTKIVSFLKIYIYFFNSSKVF